MSKHMLMLKDASLYEIIGFLDSADEHGHNIPTQIGPQVRFVSLGHVSSRLVTLLAILAGSPVSSTSFLVEQMGVLIRA